MSKSVAITTDFLKLLETPLKIMDSEEIASSFIATYEGLTGAKDGSSRWVAEKSLILNAMNTNKELAKCDPFTFYNALVELSISRLTLKDGLAYLVPFGKQCIFM